MSPSNFPIKKFDFSEFTSNQNAPLRRQTKRSCVGMKAFYSENTSTPYSPKIKTPCYSPMVILTTPNTAKPFTQSKGDRTLAIKWKCSTSPILGEKLGLTIGNEKTPTHVSTTCSHPNNSPRSSIKEKAASSIPKTPIWPATTDRYLF